MHQEGLHPSLPTLVLSGSSGGVERASRASGKHNVLSELILAPDPQLLGIASVENERIVLAVGTDQIELGHKDRAAARIDKVVMPDVPWVLESVGAGDTAQV